MNNTIKSILLMSIIYVFLISCSNNTDNSNKKDGKRVTELPAKKEIKKSNNYGSEVTMQNVADVTRVPSMMENTDEKSIKVIGKIDKVCQMEGCWIDVDMGNGELMHVTFKDEAFVVPKDIAGKTVVMDGVVTKELLPVDLLKKMAKDEGKSQKEIDEIVSPVVEYSYEATGLEIR